LHKFFVRLNKEVTMNLGKRMMNGLDRDIEEHIAMETQDNIERGMSPEEARYAALRKFGNVLRAEEETRAVWSVIWLEELFQDIRFGLRTFKKSPGFVTVAVLTLALGIGANTAIFSLIDAVMLKSLPVENPSQLVMLRWSARRSPIVHGYMSSGDCPSDLRSEAENHSGCSFSEPMFREIQRQTKLFSGAAAFASSGPLVVTGNGQASRIRGQLLSGNFFDTTGLKPAAGRLFTSSDDQPSTQPVAVLNYGYWQSAFGGSRDAIGRTVELNNVPFIIIGVVEPRFNGISPGSDYDVWLPLVVEKRIASAHGFGQFDRRNDPAQWWLTIIARLDATVPPAQAQAIATGLFRNHTLHGDSPLFHSGEAVPAKLAVHQDAHVGPSQIPLGNKPVALPKGAMIAQHLPAPSGAATNSVPPADNPEITLVPADSGLTGSRDVYSNPLYVLMMAVAIILLIACANVAGLMLARAAARQKEMAVRLALGAGRIRILRQLLTESVMLSVLGGTLGVLFAYWGVHIIIGFIYHNGQVPRGGFIPEVDLRVLAFTVTTSVVSGILFGVAPALRSIRTALAPTLKEGEGSHASPKRHRARWFNISNALVVSQMALAMVLLVGAGLLVRTLQNLRSIDVGFDTHNVLNFQINPELAGYKNAQLWSLYGDLQTRLSAIPGVQSTGYSMSAFLSGSLMTTIFHWPGTPQDQMSQADVLQIGPNFFETIHIRLLAGRDFNLSEFAQSFNKADKTMLPTPVIVNRKFVEKFVGKENPLGKRFGDAPASKFGPASPGYEIVGVASDTKYESLRREMNPIMFVPHSLGMATFELRMAADPQAILPAVRKVIADVNANMPLSGVQTESEQIDQVLFKERLVARLASFFSMLALILACIGLYGLLSYEIARRRREIGIRMALGAQARDVLRLIVKQGIALSLVGAAVGIGIALAITRYLTSMLYNVHANDPWTLIAVAILLTLISLAACLIPARRATHVDPIVTLRYE
jgi:predicted permease